MEIIYLLENQFHLENLLQEETLLWGGGGGWERETKLNLSWPEKIKLFWKMLGLINVSEEYFLNYWWADWWMMPEEEENGMMLPATILTKDSVEKVGQ